MSVTRAFGGVLRDIYEEIGNQQDIATVLGAIGSLYRRVGDLTLALKYSQQNLDIHRELGDREEIADVLSCLAFVYQMQGELKAAVTHLEQSLAIVEELGNNLYVAEILFALICVTLDQCAHDQAQEYLQRLQQIHDQEDNKILSQQYRMARGLVLKTSTRARDRVTAQELLEEVVNNEVVNHSLTVQAMLHLCELLLDEFKAYGDQAVFQDAQSLTNKINTIVEQQHSFALIVDALLLQAKFALIEGNLSQASQFLDQARLTAEEKDLGVIGDQSGHGTPTAGRPV